MPLIKATPCSSTNCDCYEKTGVLDVTGSEPPAEFVHDTSRLQHEQQNLKSAVEVALCVPDVVRLFLNQGQRQNNSLVLPRRVLARQMLLATSLHEGASNQRKRLRIRDDPGTKRLQGGINSQSVYNYGKEAASSPQHQMAPQLWAAPAHQFATVADSKPVPACAAVETDGQSTDETWVQT